MNRRSKANGTSSASVAGKLLLGVIFVLSSGLVHAEPGVCPDNGRTLTAEVAVLDQPVLFNRLGASNVNGMIYALTRDLVAINKRGAAVSSQPIVDMSSQLK